MATSYYGKLQKPESSAGLVVQYGRAKFLKKAKTVSLVTNLGTVRYFSVNYRTNAAGVKEASGVILACTGTVASQKLIVTRTTLGGTMSGAHFWYTAIGF